VQGGESIQKAGGACMKELISLLAGLCLFLSLAMASAEGQAKTSTREDKLTGTVHMVDKDTSTIIIRKGGVQRKIVYNTKGNLGSRRRLRALSTM
jgi:hypothetical protein